MQSLQPCHRGDIFVIGFPISAGGFLACHRRACCEEGKNGGAEIATQGAAIEVATDVGGISTRPSSVAMPIFVIG